MISDPVDIVVVVFIAVDVIMKLRDWVMLFLASKQDQTDDSPVALTRKDRHDLREHLVHEEARHNKHMRAITKVRLTARAALASIDPMALRDLDQQFASDTD